MSGGIVGYYFIHTYTYIYVYIKVYAYCIALYCENVFSSIKPLK